MFICDEFIRKWESNYPDSIVMAKTYDVGIVLGGKIADYDYQKDKLIFREQADRFLQAIELYQQAKIKKILITGGPGSLFFRDQYEASFLKKYLLSIHIPESDILVDSISDNTRENALNTKKILDSLSYNKGSCLLITSALHMRRSIAIFNKIGIFATAYPTSKISGDRIYNFNHLLIPHIESFECWSKLLHEWTGFLVYKMMGYA
ncbi:MAG: YdcF family protein [Bacteroidetes bacterium]|nr:YdcF family protein [Bacteroidota bacterium]